MSKGVVIRFVEHRVVVRFEVKGGWESVNLSPTQFMRLRYPDLGW